MSDPTFAVGIVGSGLVGNQIATSLIERAFPFSSLRFLVEEAAVGDTVEVEERSFAVELLSDVSRGLDLVFLTGESEWQERDVESLIAGGARVIDCSGRYAREADVPLIVPELNADQAAGELFATPDPVVVALCAVLGPLHARAGIRRVVATSLESVSDAGVAGIEELSRQAVELLQGRSTDAEVFPARICFNVLPAIGEYAPSGDTLSEEQACWQVRRILEDPELAVTLTRLRAPVFFGTCIALNVELQTPIDAEETGELLRTSPGLLASAADEEADLSLADAVGQDATLVGRLRVDRSAENTLNLWIALDNARKGSAVNAVEIAELLIR